VPFTALHLPTFPVPFHINDPIDPQGPTDYYQYIHIDVKWRYNESDYFFRLFFGGRGFARLASLELHSDSHYLRRGDVCEEAFLPVITWTRERLFFIGEIIALYIHTVFLLLLIRH